MNPESTPLTLEEREAWEIRIVSTLFGEADETELQAVADAIAKYPELAAFRQQMQQMTGLLREAAKLEENPAPKLHPVKRDVLLRKLANKPLLLMAPRKSSRKFQFSWVSAAAACFLVFLFVAMSIPSFQKVRSDSPEKVAATQARRAVMEREIREEADLLAKKRAPRGDNRGDLSSVDQDEVVYYGGKSIVADEEGGASLAEPAVRLSTMPDRYFIPTVNQQVMVGAVGAASHINIDPPNLLTGTGNSLSPVTGGSPALVNAKREKSPAVTGGLPGFIITDWPTSPETKSDSRQFRENHNSADQSFPLAVSGGRAEPMDQVAGSMDLTTKVQSDKDATLDDQGYGLAINSTLGALQTKSNAREFVAGGASPKVRNREFPATYGMNYSVIENLDLYKKYSESIEMKGLGNVKGQPITSKGESEVRKTINEEDLIELSPFDVESSNDSEYAVVAGELKNAKTVDSPHLGGFLSTSESSRPKMYATTTGCVTSEPASNSSSFAPSPDLKLDLWDGLFTEVNSMSSVDLSLTADASSPQSQLPDSDDPTINQPKRVLEPLTEITTVDQPLSTFSLNVSDVSFRLAAEALKLGNWPQADALRTEEFINAVNYHDPLPPEGTPIGFNWEIARWPFAHDRALLRLSVRAGAQGRDAARPLRIVVAMDQSGSMARPDRQAVMNAAIQALVNQLHPEDRLSVVTFNRTAQLVVDNKPPKADILNDLVSSLNPVGGTNLEQGLSLAYATAGKNFLPSANNRVILFTDGAANLGDLLPESLQSTVETMRKRGIALDCFGIGLDGYNDTMLETLSRHGDGRYGFLQQPADVESQFTKRLLGALQVAAQDLKVQVEWNPGRVKLYRQVGYKLHQLKAEDFRNNAVDAAELGAAEAGTAAYFVELLPDGVGALGTVHVRYRVPGTDTYEEKAWPMLYTPVVDLNDSMPSMRLMGGTIAFAEWLSNNPYAQGYSLIDINRMLESLPVEWLSQDAALRSLEQMIQSAQRLGAR